jgi:hypothetical protein
LRLCFQAFCFSGYTGSSKEARLLQKLARKQKWQIRCLRHERGKTTLLIFTYYPKTSVYPTTKSGIKEENGKRWMKQLNL